MAPAEKMWPSFLEVVGLSLGKHLVEFVSPMKSPILLPIVLLCHSEERFNVLL